MTVPLHELTDAWTDVSHAFSAIKMNVADGGHGPGSLLLDLQMNGVSQFSVDPSGTVLLLPDLKFFRDSAGPSGAALALRNGLNPQALRVYNTYTDNSNYERGGCGWLVSPNLFAVGTMAAGSGVVRMTQLLGSNFLIAGIDLGIFRVAPGVLEINNGNPGTRQNCYLQWGGLARVVNDQSITSNATLADVGGLVVNVQSNRTYAFDVELSFTCAAAGGIKCAMGGNATVTNIIYDGWIVDSAANGIKGNAQATALGGAVAAAATIGTAGHVTIRGTITVNAGGALTVQAAQNAINATATVIKRGSRMIVQDLT
jgi:hypothetical protein